jgi:folate-binding protein YgfZ
MESSANDTKAGNDRNAGDDAMIDRQYRAIRSGAGVIVLDDRAVVRVIGDDRLAFMHGMSSADLKGLKSGGVSPALILTEHAHVIAELFVYALADELLIEADRATWPAARAHLERLLVADDVEFEEMTELCVIDLEGPRAYDALRDLYIAEAKGWSQIEATAAATDLGVRLMAAMPRFGAPAITLIADRADTANVVARLRVSYRDVTELTPEAVDILRVENGIARVGTDTSDKTLALEARLERAISFNKGCYVGQETIERATARGALKKRLCGLLIEGARVPSTGAPITMDGREIGRLTSVVRSPERGLIGLAIIHHAAWQAGTCVAIAEGAGAIRATVSELPFDAAFAGALADGTTEGTRP